MFRDAGVRRFLLDGVLVERDWVRPETDRHGLDAVDTAVDAPNVASLRVLRRSAARPAPSERRSTSGLRAPTGIGAMPREACTHER